MFRNIVKKFIIRRCVDDIISTIGSTSFLRWIFRDYTMHFMLVLETVCYVIQYCKSEGDLQYQAKKDATKKLSSDKDFLISHIFLATNCNKNQFIVLCYTT